MKNRKPPATYRDLDIYQLAHRLGVDIHNFTLRLPKFELYETGSQLRRASKSISANIVEGYSRRRYKAEFIRFLIYAHSSCNESIEWVEYVRDCHEGFKTASEEFLERLDKLGAKINRFISAVETKHKVFKQ
jgi:four helix bundle protein